jgi:4-hydroxy-tetrahydrodipicolinate reductase
MKIAIVGYGKMGKTIEKIVLEKGYLEPLVIHNKEELRLLKGGEIDVAIEFSRPEAAVANLKYCLEQQIPVVCGTTGWLDQLPTIQELCLQQQTAFLYASNFSIGVNIFFELNRKLAELMGKHAQYRVDMTEIHHTQKLDAPSGTAITLANDIIRCSDQYDGWSLGSDAQVGKIAIKDIREGEVPGTHIIHYRSDIDTITIAHEAHSRLGFATGAVLAAEWLVGRKGNFSMKDVLGL